MKYYDLSEEIKKGDETNIYRISDKADKITKNSMKCFAIQMILFMALIAEFGALCIYLVQSNETFKWI